MFGSKGFEWSAYAHIEHNIATSPEDQMFLAA